MSLMKINESDSLHYKGYVGSIDYDPINHLWIGKVVNTNQVLNYESKLANDLETKFHVVVDQYLDMNG